MSKNLVDTSAWLEYFTNGSNADYFSFAIENTSDLLVSTINVYEIYKKIYSEKGKSAAIEATAIVMQGNVIDVDYSIAIHAAQISLNNKIPMADSILLATAQKYKATLWTQDKHFENINAEIKYKSKTS